MHSEKGLNQIFTLKLVTDRIRVPHPVYTRPDVQQRAVGTVQRWEVAIQNCA